MGIAVAVGVTVLTAGASAVALAADDGRRVLPRAGHDPILGSAAAQEWVAHGDHAAVVRVTRESAAEAGPKDGDYVPRTVTATVTRVIWSRPGAARLPEELTLRAHGWYTTLWGGREEAAREGAPRLEPGHTYVVGVVATARGAELIGDDAAVPYDDETLGLGELEGRAVTPNAYRRAVRGLPDDAVAGFAAGETYAPRTLRDVQRLLEVTSPRNVYRRTALQGLSTDLDLDRKADRPVDEGSGDLPGRIRRSVPALEPGSDYFLAVACSGRGKDVTVGLTVGGEHTTHRLPCNTGDELVAVRQPLGEVTFEIASKGPDVGAVAWNVSRAPEVAGRNR
ncbi:hypothetical protein AB0E77_11185 [Streptomyces sp. NPDC032940]|uniref:hypothetical protein n=1 Tax=Streptomyces sp. NPDC032940 TaxID=3155366 RepID=UPI0033DB332B